MRGRVRPPGPHRRRRPLRMGGREPRAPLGLGAQAALHRAALDGLARAPRRDPVRTSGAGSGSAARAGASTRAPANDLGGALRTGLAEASLEPASLGGASLRQSSASERFSPSSRASKASLTRSGVLREHPLHERAAVGVSSTTTARRSAGRRWRSTNPRPSRVSVTSVAFALLQSKRRRRVRSSSAPPAVVSTTSAEKPAADTPARSSSTASRRRTVASARTRA